MKSPVTVGKSMTGYGDMGGKMRPCYYSGELEWCQEDVDEDSDEYTGCFWLGKGTWEDCEVGGRDERGAQPYYQGTIRGLRFRVAEGGCVIADQKVGCVYGNKKRP